MTNQPNDPDVQYDQEELDSEPESDAPAGPHEDGPLPDEAPHTDPDPNSDPQTHPAPS